MKSITIGISGASGVIYPQRLLVHLDKSSEVSQINLIISGPGRRVINDELEVSGQGDAEQLVEELLGRRSTKVVVFHPGDIGASIASGSFPVNAMAVVPCSASTLGALASGASRNLLHRAADVCLKENRTLVLVVRETPFSALHLENMLRLRQAGAIIAPACPSYYHRPTDITSLADHFVYRIMDHLGIPHSQESAWQGSIRKSV